MSSVLRGIVHPDQAQGGEASPPVRPLSKRLHVDIPWIFADTLDSCSVAKFVIFMNILGGGGRLSRILSNFANYYAICNTLEIHRTLYMNNAN